MLKALDTPYKGHLFRSRLEARWAVFFDALGVQWEYEVEGYDLDGVWYLPDFRLKTPQGEDRWIEVKPSKTTEDRKFDLFSKKVTRAELVSGSPLQHLARCRCVCPRCGLFLGVDWSRVFEDNLEFIGTIYERHRYYCFQCDLETPQGGDNDWEHNGFLGASYKPYKGDILVIREDVRMLRRLILEAATQAQRARFEHGANAL